MNTHTMKQHGSLSIAVIVLTAALMGALAGCQEDTPASTKPGQSPSLHQHDTAMQEEGTDDHESELDLDLTLAREYELADEHTGEAAHEHGPACDHDQEAELSAVAIPQTVRRNLGITFVQAELRPIRSTMRIAGEFELRPEARREYHVMLPGRIDLKVRQYERVQAGQPLFTLDSPQWQQMQAELVAALNAMKRSHADVAVVEAKLSEIEKSIAFMEKRIANLAEAKVRQVELEALLTDKRNTLPALEAQRQAARVEFEAVHTQYDVMLSTAASLTGIPREELDPDHNGHAHMEGHTPPWLSIRQLTIHAEADGVVDRLPVTNRGWVETGDLVLDTVDPDMLRFHADALQTDINRFADGQSARIVPPQGGSFDLQDTADGRIEVGFAAHAKDRTIPIYLSPDAMPRWAKAGVTAYLEVYLDGDESPVVAIPEAAVVRDGLDRVFFLRDPHDADLVIRVVAELGVSDNRWVEVRSGVSEGDEIVLGGVYPLMLSSSSSGERLQGGHICADGSFHTGEH